MPAHSCSFTHTQLDGTGWSAAKMAKDAFPAKPVPQGAVLRASTYHPVEAIALSYVPVFAVSPRLPGRRLFSREVQLRLQTDKMHCCVLDIESRDSELLKGTQLLRG